LITIRLDVDYPYTSRLKSFISVALKLKLGRGYLKNAKIIARMINESFKPVRAYWFFTPETVPDKELLALMNNERHVIGLHVVRHPEREIEMLEHAAGRRVEWYTIHGTARLLARLMWRRFLFREPTIPERYRAQYFRELGLGLDKLCFSHDQLDATRITKHAINRGLNIHIHPIWLFQTGKLNYRGAYYQVLREILDVDPELENFAFYRRFGGCIACNRLELLKPRPPTKKLLAKLALFGVDLLNFAAVPWNPDLSNRGRSVEDNIAVLHITSLNEWFTCVGRKTRNMIRKAQKNGVVTNELTPDETFIEAVFKIYNETPVRQGRAYPHYGITLDAVKKDVDAAHDDVFVSATLNGEIIGFIQLNHYGEVAVVSQILSLQSHWDKAVNNVLIAKTVEVCEKYGFKTLVYGRFGNHPTLDQFKKSNGFSKVSFRRNFIPLSRRGGVIILLGLQRPLKDRIPVRLKPLIIPIYSFFSRLKIRSKGDGNEKVFKDKPLSIY